jgi:MinD-like ATPase involved in chromosome partitioning or flagellar assembly
VERPGTSPDPENWWGRYGHRVRPVDGPVPTAPQPAGTGAESASSAAELTDEPIVRDEQRDEPASGWRRAVLRLSGGVVNPGPGPAERQHRELLHRIRRPLLQTRHIAVASMKGGVGKTTVATLLGLVLAETRGDRVIALDANPDAGTLADRLTGEATVTVRELVRDLDRIDSWAAVSHYTSLVGRLQVLASEQDPAAAGGGLSRAEYDGVCALLEHYFNIVVTDSGTGFLHPTAAGILGRAHSLVIVGAPTVDGAGRASRTLDWLWSNGFGALATDAVAVLSSARSSAEVNTARIREHFAARCRAVVEIPHDPQLAVGGRVELARLQPATRAAAFELTALIADDFTS